ncbi:hypothetical protein PFISCL1PPCAC_9732, partial [Pristionchus fissidentatus]
LLSEREVQLSMNGQKRCYDLKPCRGQFPDTETMTNLVVLSDSVYCWCTGPTSLQLWTIDMNTMAWQGVLWMDVDSWFAPGGLVLRVKDKAAGILELTEIYETPRYYYLNVTYFGLDHIYPAVMAQRKREEESKQEIDNDRASPASDGVKSEAMSDEESDDSNIENRMETCDYSSPIPLIHFP